MENKIQNLNEVVGLITEDAESLTKERLNSIADRIFNAVDAGIQEPLPLIAKLDFISKAAIAAKKMILDEGITDLEKYGKQDAIIHGATMKIKEAGVKYDYSNSKIWLEFQDQIDALIESRKVVESRLKTITTAVEESDVETGETFILNPPIKTSTTTIQISYPKQ